ncbi:MAG: Hsp70 family protein [Ruminococcus sp.]|nr:Hsp70 family protein [Ruminococcus sp.]
MAVIGIDLGTTNSLGAVYRNNRVELIPNRYGSFLTPSVISIDEENNILVGQVAKERLITYPKLTASSFKKDMGTDKKYLLGKKTFSPEELSSFVLRSIIDDAREYLQEEIEEVIISVPAYFNDRQRVATKQAGVLAGVQTKRIINEPSAAALASYFDTSKEQVFLIFDFGGGTLDISLVECFDTMVEILSVSGDNRLGGDNFHEIMAESFLREHGLSRKKITDKEYAVLIRQAEKCKQMLTSERNATITVAINGEVFRSEYTNQRLLEESGTIFSRIKKVLAHALRDGDMTITDIDAVVMVGGSSKMPLIQSYLQHLLRKMPIVAGNCDEMIAKGLGLVCAVKERQQEVKDYILTDICPFTLGTDVHNEADPEHSYMSPIISRNTVLPCSRVKRFHTIRDNQQKVTLNILQGEQVYAEDNLKLDVLELSVPKAKKGQEEIDVRFTYDINGILIVDATVISTGKTISKVVSQNVDEKELQRKIQELEKLKVHPKNISENRLIMERLHSLYEEASPDLREQVGMFIRNFEMILEKQDSRKIKRYRSFLKEVIQQTEVYDPFGEIHAFDTFDENWDEDDEWDADDEVNFYNPGGSGRWTS